MGIYKIDRRGSKNRSLGRTQQSCVISDVRSKKKVFLVFFYHQVGIFLHQVVGNPVK